jgi:hypothetical protein
MWKMTRSFRESLLTNSKKAQCSLLRIDCQPLRIQIKSWYFKKAIWLNLEILINCKTGPMDFTHKWLRKIRQSCYRDNSIHISIIIFIIIFKLMKERIKQLISRRLSVS